jgi:hypothetical protein
MGRYTLFYKDDLEQCTDFRTYRIQKKKTLIYTVSCFRLNTSMEKTYGKIYFIYILKAVFRIHRIHVFLGLPDPDLLVRGMDPDPALDPKVSDKNRRIRIRIQIRIH